MNKHATYSRPAILMHWLQALLIIGLLALGWYMTGLPKGDGRSAMFNLHKSLGLCALLLLILRLAWRLYRQPPPLHLGSALQIKVAHWVHHTLYALLFLIPLSGYLLTAHTQYPLRFFSLEIPRLFNPDKALNALFKAVHEYLGWFLVALLILHLAAAMYHHFYKKDETLLRMLPYK